MKTSMLEKKRHAKVDVVKSVPKVARSAKYLAQLKKEAKVIDPYTGELVTMDEMMARSKEGGAGKGGARAR